MMGKMFMANLYASLDSTWKSRFSQISKIQGGVYSTTFDPELRIEVKNFPMLGESIPQLLILSSEMQDLHWYLL